MGTLLDEIAEETMGKSYKTFKYEFEGSDLPKMDYDDQLEFTWQRYGETAKVDKTKNLKDRADSKADSMESACDAGTLDIDIECNDGKHVFVAAAMDSEGQLAVISYEIRCILEQDEVWAFDGAYGRKPGDIVLCDVEFPGSKCCYCYKSGELPVKYNDKVMVPTGPMDAETAGVVKDIHYVNPTGENEPFGKLKGIIRILNQVKAFDTK